MTAAVAGLIAAAAVEALNSGQDHPFAEDDQVGHPFCHHGGCKVDHGLSSGAAYAVAGSLGLLVVAEVAFQVHHPAAAVASSAFFASDGDHL